MYFRGPSGYVALQDLRLHGLRVRGHEVVGAKPGLLGTEQPAELNVRMNPGPRFSLSDRSTWFWVLGVMAWMLLGDVLGWSRWVAPLLAGVAGVFYVFWPLLTQVGVMRRWALSQECVTLTLSGAEPYDVLEVRRGDPPQEWPLSAHGLVLVVFDLLPAERVRLVRAVLSYQAMQARRKSKPGAG